MKKKTNTDMNEIALTPEQAERMLQFSREADGIDYAISSAMSYAERRHESLLARRRVLWDEVLGEKALSEKWFYDADKKVVYRDGSKKPAKRDL